MKLIPYEEILYHTNLSVAEVLERLRPHSGMANQAEIASAEYSGNVEGLNFLLKKKEGVNPFHPVIEGTVEKLTDQTRIDATFSLENSIVVLFTVWAGMLIILSVYLLFIAWKGNTDLSVASLPFILLVVSYLILISVFYLESKGPKKTLDRILEPTEKE